MVDYIKRDYKEKGRSNSQPGHIMDPTVRKTNSI